MKKFYPRCYVRSAPKAGFNHIIILQMNIEMRNALRNRDIEDPDLEELQKRIINGIDYTDNLRKESYYQDANNEFSETNITTMFGNMPYIVVLQLTETSAQEIKDNDPETLSKLWSQLDRYCRYVDKRIGNFPGRDSDVYVPEQEPIVLYKE